MYFVGIVAGKVFAFQNHAIVHTLNGVRFVLLERRCGLVSRPWYIPAVNVDRVFSLSEPTWYDTPVYW